MTRVDAVALTVAASATVYAAAAFITGNNNQFTAAAVTAILTLGVVFTRDYLAAERRRRRLIAHLELLAWPEPRLRLHPDLARRREAARADAQANRIK